MIFSSDQGKGLPFSTKAAIFFLLAGLLIYPFTIAGSNFFFALLLITIILFQRDIFIQGWSVCWQEYRHITIGILLLVGFNIIGSLWSGAFIDTDLALHKISKQINWLFIPIIIGLVFINPKLRLQAFIFLSIGMFLHLIVCTLQDFGVLHIARQGSHLYDATGYVGHLGFGFIYGIWAGALLVVAQHLPTKWKYICYALSLYAVITVFLAQGRSGYITTLACLSIVFLKVWFPQCWKLKLFILSVLIVALVVFVNLHKPIKTEVENTVAGVSSFLNGDWKNAEIRIKIWAVSLEIWKEHPFFGVGTSGYPDAAKAMLATSNVDYLKIDPAKQQVFYGHPHQEFLFALARWGPLGLLALVYLCWNWLRTGWQKDWQSDNINAYLITASALSIILHGMTEPSLNVRIETVFAIITLGFGMSKPKQVP